ncbi:MAG: cation transporter [Betaproteobacteria bacterium RIFCSPLOWO2_12_FULL_63_13]|nr:MAG: cation transporter [Betaproteobacteria bacterium RIFCSPLOWO2_02_FULL_63_19]OGA48141.1 MAG: cation transporter [Betaproteobacteria bacterium RIFCSPLOWO2_12_FULL_63_13]
MTDCCEDKSCTVEALAKRQRATLTIVLAINAVMFAVELVSGLMANSSSLLSDSLDNLGDALTYGLSLYAVNQGMRAKAKVALFKGALILTAALFVLGQIAYRLLSPVVPSYETMGVISLLALIANATCLGLLWKHRADDVNMSSVWECSRNDIASNVSVFVAAAGVWATASGWPDLLIALALAVLFLGSALRVFRNAFAELKQPAAVPVQIIGRARR